MAEPLTALKGGPYYDFICNKSPKCPHCGEDFNVEDGEAWELYDDDDSHDVTCQSCEQSFRVITNKTVTFSTDEQDEE